MGIRTRASVFIFSVSLCSSFAISGKTGIAEGTLADPDLSAPVMNNQSASKYGIQSQSQASSSNFPLPELNLTSNVRRKKSAGVPFGTLFDLMPIAARYANLLPLVMNIIRPMIRVSQSSRQQSIQQPGGIAFPSLEGALLSLAFLTFAVFLVDLVQQVLGRLRTGTAVPLGGRSRGRRKRRSIESFGLLEDKFGEVFSTLSSNIITAIENPLYPDMNKQYK